MSFHSIDNVNVFLKSYYENSPLYGSPKPIKEQGYDAVQCIYFHEFLKDAVCDFSIVMPIYNQMYIIQQNVMSVIMNTGGFYEIIIILDSCTDKSKDSVLDCFKNFTGYNGFVRIIICESVVPLFETVCDNIGFRLGSGKWFLEIQADMTMTQKNYNLELTKPFFMFNNIIAVSGRCSHSLDEKNFIGKFANLAEKCVHELGIRRNIFYVNEVCNRGPLLLCSEKVRAMGYLDETNFYLDYSEIDLMLRAYEKYKWICGYVPIDYESPLNNGSTRKERNEINNTILNIRRRRGTGGFVKTYLQRGIFRNGYAVPLF